MKHSHRLREIHADDLLIAHIYDTTLREAVTFPTPPDAEMQCGFGFVAQTRTLRQHLHQKLQRSIQRTSEFIFVIEGVIHVDVLDPGGRFLETVKLTAGMALLQFEGGHGFTIEGGTRYIEVKQGPYYGDGPDKNWL